MSVELGGARQEFQNPKNKPVEFILSPHGKKEVALLPQVEGHIRTALATRPGKTAIFLENSAGTREGSQAITDAFTHGAKISDLYLPTTPFIKERGIMIDRIATEHPNRLVVVPEWQAPEMIEQAKEISALGRSIYDAPNAKKIKRYLAITPQYDERRDSQISSIINGTLQRPDVSGVEAIVGEAHTAPYHEVRESGYPVNRVFLSKENGVLVFDPLEALVRQQRLQPEQPASDADIALTVKRVRSQSLREMLPIGKSRQQILRRVYQKVR